MIKERERETDTYTQRCFLPRFDVNLCELVGIHGKWPFTSLFSENHWGWTEVFLYSLASWGGGRLFACFWFLLLLPPISHLLWLKFNTGVPSYQNSQCSVYVCTYLLYIILYSRSCAPIIYLTKYNDRVMQIATLCYLGPEAPYSAWSNYFEGIFSNYRWSNVRRLKQRGHCIS